MVRQTYSTQPPRVTKKRPPPIVLILAGFILVGAYHWGKPLFRSADPDPSSLQNRISSGERILVRAAATPEKQAGVMAVAAGSPATAMGQFQDSLLKHRNDPETLIYFNNLLAHDSKFKIAVNVPIGSNLNVAEEILRGVAQAQDEINRSRGGSLKQMRLQVQIVDDENNPQLAQQLATHLVQDSQILAVVGHNASNASLAAAPIYQQGGLVMISPTSFSNQLSGLGSYIFRTVAASRFMADPLAQYAVKTAGKTRIAVCYDSQAPDNLSFKDEFIASLLAQGGRLVPIDCNLADPGFDPTSIINRAVSSAAEGLLITSHVDRLERAIALAQVNRGRLALFGSPTLYTIKTLEQGRDWVNGLVLPAVWHPQAHPANSFQQEARRRWGGKVNWRTATAYDATRAIVTAFRPGMTRSDLQQALRSPGFVAQGAGEAVQFLPSGDRLGKVLLVQVKSGPSGSNFVLQPSL